MSGVDDKVPSHFICPLTHQFMVHPMMTKTGYTYECEAIVAWVQEHGTCPMTRQSLRNSDLVTNHSLKKKILAWCKENDVILPEVTEDEHIHRSLRASSICEDSKHTSHQGMMRNVMRNSGVLTIEDTARLLPLAGVSANRGDLLRSRKDFKLSQVLVNVMLEI
jgi:U-box domain